MELEHLFQQTTFFMTLQAVFMASVYMIEQMSSVELVNRFVRNLAHAVVNVGPMALLVYVLFEVSRFS